MIETRSCDMLPATQSPPTCRHNPHNTIPLNDRGMFPGHDPSDTIATRSRNMIPQHNPATRSWRHDSRDVILRHARTTCSRLDPVTCSRLDPRDTLPQNDRHIIPRHDPRNTFPMT
ncbi:hypothetical protein TURU_011781 [Turdus rufiventris]|nr:hypothetical protein TURU_011781 [Turdus rufiventris]